MFRVDYIVGFSSDNCSSNEENKSDVSSFFNTEWIVKFFKKQFADKNVSNFAKYHFFTKRWIARQGYK